MTEYNKRKIKAKKTKEKKRKNKNNKRLWRSMGMAKPAEDKYSGDVEGL